ncbi:peptide-methionine (S)-S-oxide reductase MsrA [Lutibacter maritimus]|uniref:Peptide methionine sulfoxide reductase MsrA n=1 Tax=Lutibacter maritimus TaxID=593133 RepID=A0A1I6NTV1_9FLAO|nr:peptide-methionine (S)-S-oxide reductase [Lutibacter maritimus]
MKKIILVLIVLGLGLSETKAQSTFTKKNQMNKKIETATLANGCFWCTEAIFQRLKGVESVTSGFSGGNIKNPAYREVITGRTGHAEAIEIKFDATIISFQEILDVFFSTHDPTTLNRQGYDVGTQYRSAIFYHSEEQKNIAENFIKELTNAKVFDAKIVTEVTEFTSFYKAEDYHQNYYNNNKTQGYCVAVINPKLEKFIKKYKAKLKD